MDDWGLSAYSFWLGGIGPGIVRPSRVGTRGRGLEHRPLPDAILITRPDVPGGRALRDLMLQVERRARE